VLKKILGVVAPILKSKKFQTFIVTVLAGLCVRKLGLEPEVANELAKHIVYAGIAVILAQGAADLGSGGRTSANYTAPENGDG
jgi:hypothetical protein